MLTDHLDSERRAVQQEQGHVQEVEERLDVRQRVRVLLQARQRHVDGACAHSDRELRVCVAASLVSAYGPTDRKSTRLNSSHSGESRMPSSA